MTGPYLHPSPGTYRRAAEPYSGPEIRPRQRNTTFTQPGAHRAFWSGAGRTAGASITQLRPRSAEPLKPDAESNPRRAARTEVRPKRVLLVEGDAWSRHVLRRMLECRGLDVSSARDNIDAMNRLHFGVTFDLMLLGLELPGGGGIGLLHRMRAEGYKTQVLVLSRQATGRAIMNCHKFGIAYWLSKPISELELDLALDFTVGDNTQEERAAILVRLNELTEGN